MSAVALPAPATRGVRRTGAAVVLPLAAVEARRLLLHPVMLAGIAVFLVHTISSTLTDPTPRTAFSAVVDLPSFVPGVFAILAANLVASRDVRAGSVEMLTPAPARPAPRVGALCLAGLVPAVLMQALVLVLWAWHLALERYVDPPTAAHLLQGPVTVAGACLLGVLLAVWVPTRATGIIALVVMVALNVWLGGREGAVELFGPMVHWPEWGLMFARDWVGFIPGSPGWHVVYLLGLTAAAGAGALVRVSDRRTPAVLATLAALALAVVAGIAQLP
ncbi:MAG TPA: hypothetical protein VKZ83_04430 [Phototrophicaceae bacterium]|nr:hypothetical protein [Phototrophicaceae bacterium]